MNFPVPERSGGDNGEESSDSSNKDRPSLVEKRVRAVLKIKHGGHCALDDLPGEIVDADIRFQDGECHCDVALQTADDGESRMVRTHVSESICSHCPGVRLPRFDCIPQFVETDNGAFVIRTFASDSETIADLVEELRQCCESVRLESLTGGDNEEVFTESRDLDLSTLTDKQRTALEEAIDCGYYQSESGCGLDCVAKKLDVSRSAVSQRLGRAEERIMRQLL